MTDASNASGANGGVEAGELVMLPLGGVGEIGMNCYLYGLGPANDRRWLMVDLGITFPGPHEPGVDVILPDLTFIEARKKRLEGLVLTHAHEDHYGAILDMWERLQVPIYSTPFTLAMLSAKIAERAPHLKIPMHELPRNAKSKIGPFDIELVDVAHSIPEPNAIVFHTPYGRALHTGDWKIDPDPRVDSVTSEAAFRRIGDMGVDAIVCDSTNAVREGASPSEKDVLDALTKIIADAPYRVAVTTFASNVGRIRSIYEAGKAAGRDVALVGRAMHRTVTAARETGHLPDDMTFVNEEDAKYLPRDKLVVMLTGSQGESRAAMARIANNENPIVPLSKGDMIIFSSRTIPGNEKSVGHVQNTLVEAGYELVTDSDGLVHVTGHPRVEELRQMYSWVRPKVCVPMHGEARHLKAHAKLAKEFGVPKVVNARNGTMVRLFPGEAKIIDDAPVGRLHRDGKLVMDSLEIGVRERRRLAQVGIAFVTFVMNGQGDVVAEPDVALDGIPEADSRGDNMEDIVLDAVEGALESTPRKVRKDAAKVAEAVRRAARNAIGDAWGKRPIVKVIVSKV